MAHPGVRAGRLPSEFELIARYFEPLAREFPGAYGLRDDAAVISPLPGCELVVKTDTIVSGIDFFPDTAAGLIGRKALRVNLSDLAAKGATARAYLLMLALSESVDEQWVAALAEGLAQDQAQYGIHLIGGDTGSTTGPVVVTVCAFGDVPAGRIVRRGGARPNDIVFVTGTVGDAALGLAALREDLQGLDCDSTAFLIDRYRLPRPRVSVGNHLTDIATASVDISEGLVADLRHLCGCSGLTAVISAPSVPLSPAGHVAVEIDPGYLLTALTGGDDYEIVFTAPATAAGRVDDLSRMTGVAITAIGYMTASDDPGTVAVLDESERPVTLQSEGWTHFGS